MIIGAHAILYSRDAEADRAFLRDVLGLRGVDAGGGWLIFGLPPSEVAVHPSEGNDGHELYLLVDDVAAFVRALGRKGVACAPVTDQRWGLLTTVTLPGGGQLGVYEPKHRRPAGSRPKSKSKSKSAGSRSGSRSGSRLRSKSRSR